MVQKIARPYNHPPAADDGARDAAISWAASVMNVPPYATPPEKLNMAAQLVRAGKVTAQNDGTWRVQGSQLYEVDEVCSCYQGQHGQTKWCKHLVAVELARRTAERLSPATQAPEPVAPDTAAQLAPPLTPALALPEAPASANVYVEVAGRKVQLTLRDVSEDRLLTRLEAVLARFPVAPLATQTPRLVRPRLRRLAAFMASKR